MLTIIDKMQINRMLKLPFEEIDYLNIMGPNTKDQLGEVVEFLFNKTCKVLEENDSPKIFSKYLKVLDSLITTATVSKQQLILFLKNNLGILVKLYEDYERKDAILDLEFQDFSTKYTTLGTLEKLNSSDGQNLHLKEELVFLKDQLNELIAVNEKLQLAKEELLSKNADLLEKNASLTNKEVQNLKKALQEEALLKHSTAIEEAVIQELYSSGQTLTSLKDNLMRQGKAVTLNELATVLLNLKKRLALAPLQFLGGKAFYNFDYNPASSLKTFKVFPAVYQEPLNLLVTSDFHLNANTKLTDCKFEELYDYCVANNIKCILNLGDFFDTVCATSNFNRSLPNLLETERLIDQVAISFPKVPGIYQGILAGNHDRIFNKLAISPIEKLTEQREDLFFLGYDTALVELSDAASNNTLSLHHLRYRYEGAMNNRDVNNLIKSSLKGQEDLNKIYFSLLGHTHRSLGEFSHNFGFVPSYTKDRFQNGAWQLKVYYNSDRTIDYIIFTPLILTDKLYKAGEFVYKRTLAKN